MKEINEWPEKFCKGGKRTHIEESAWSPDCFLGYGKDEACRFEGSWFDLICLAKNILASENTRLVAPEFYHPEWRNNHYTGKPYNFVGEAGGTY